MVFGGIAGVVSSEQGDPDDIGGGPLPSINTKSSEASDMQDLYRRTLAASWKSRSSDLPADKLIEDLFSGGSGYQNGTHGVRMSRLDDSLNGSSSSSDANPSRGTSTNRLSPGFQRQPKSSWSNNLPNESKGRVLLSAMGDDGNGGSIEQQIQDNSRTKVFRSRAPEQELSEFDVREDLRNWEITPKS